MINSGLQPTPTDPRDFSTSKTFGAVKNELPANFLLTPLAIKDQRTTDLCTAFSACVLAEYQDGVEMSPEWFFSRYGKPGLYGANLRDAAKAGVDNGFLEKTKSPYTVENQDRDFLAEKNNWSKTFDFEAYPHKKKSYFNIDLPFDTFENIKQALYRNNCPILTGAMWYSEWQYATNGYIPKTYSGKTGLHAFAIIGWAGDNYIIVQNSYGTDVGDNGLFYFPVSVVNKEFTEPLFCFVDLDENTEVISQGNWFQKYLFKLLELLK